MITAMDTKQLRRFQKAARLDRAWSQWHNNLHLADTQSPWHRSDSQERWQENMQRTATKVRLQTLGFDNEHVVQYSFNPDGFRSHTFGENRCVLVLGCSHVFGLGLPQHQRWTDVVASRLGMPIHNLGVPGSSLDTCFRLLVHWLPRLDVGMVIIAVPPPERVEFPSADGRPLTQGPQWVDGEYRSAYLTWSRRDEHLVAHETKNLLACKQLTDLAGANFDSLWLDEWYPSSMAHSVARDLAHPGQAAHIAAAELMTPRIEKGMTS